MTAYQRDILAVAESELPWEKLSGTKILVTGATGLIGSCIVEVLMARQGDFEVYASGRNKERAEKLFGRFWNKKNFHYFRYDVLESLEGEICFDFIIHAASNASPNFFSEKPVDIMMSNIVGLNNLLSYGLKHNMRRLLYVSTGEVYGQGDGRVFTEDYSGYVDPTSARSCYPSAKRASETLCASYIAQYGADVVIARPCHVYGPNFTESDNRVYAQFLRNALRGEDIVMKSSGEQYRSWCYVVDCVSALMFILLKGKTGEAYNVADEESNITIRDLARLTCEVSGTKLVIEIAEEAERKGYNPVTKSIFSTNKLQKLGWCTHTHITSGIKKCFEQLKA